MHTLRKHLVLPAQKSQRGLKNPVKALSDWKQADGDNEEAFLISHSVAQQLCPLKCIIWHCLRLPLQEQEEL